MKILTKYLYFGDEYSLLYCEHFLNSKEEKNKSFEVHSMSLDTDKFLLRNENQAIGCDINWFGRKLKSKKGYVISRHNGDWLITLIK